MLFLAKFFLTYIFLAFAYQLFLNRFEYHETDSITRIVAQHTQQFLQFFNADVALDETTADGYIKLFYNHTYIARLIEGCNAVSILILFVSFIVSFSGKLKTTFFFILGGSLFIYLLNVVRIALLCVLIYNFPAQESMLHGVFFPLFIYGVVFLLWVIWVNKYSLYAKKST